MLVGDDAGDAGDATGSISDLIPDDQLTGSDQPTEDDDLSASQEPTKPSDDKDPADSADSAQPVEKPVDQQSQSDWDDETGEPSIRTNNKGEKIYQWPEPRAKRIYEGYKLSKEYGEIAPTVADAKAHSDAFTQRELMLGDLTSDDPARVDTFLGWMNRTSPKAMEHAASLLPKGLKTANPEAYQKLRTGVFEDAASEFYTAAKQAQDAGNTQDADRYLFLAQSIDYHLNRPFLANSFDEIKLQTPVDQREAELVAREAKIREQEQRNETARWDSWRQSTNAAIKSEVDSLLTSALEPLKHIKEQAPRLFERARKQLLDDVRAGIASDKNFDRLFQSRFMQAKTSQTEDVRAALKQQYVARVRTEINKARRSIIEDFGATYLKQASDRRDKQANAASRREPTTQGTATNGGVPLADKVKNAKTAGDKIDALLGIG